MSVVGTVKPVEAWENGRKNDDDDDCQLNPAFANSFVLFSTGSEFLI